jgi:hypothetical protein
MVVVEEMDRAGTAVTGMLLADLAVGMARAVKGRTEDLETMEDRKEAMVDHKEAMEEPKEAMEDHKEAMGARMETLDQEIVEDLKTVLDQETTEARIATLVQEALVQEATEARTATQALTMGLANRTQELSHKSTYTRR